MRSLHAQLPSAGGAGVGRCGSGGDGTGGRGVLSCVSQPVSSRDVSRRHISSVIRLFIYSSPALPGSAPRQPKPSTHSQYTACSRSASHPHPAAPPGWAGLFPRNHVVHA